MSQLLFYRRSANRGTASTCRRIDFHSVLWILSACIVLAAPQASMAVPGTPTAQINQILYLEPIEGLTTVRHLAPSQVAIPIGRTVQLFAKVPTDATVSWIGANELFRGVRGSVASCPLDATGDTAVHLLVVLPDGTDIQVTCLFEVLDISVDDIIVEATASPTDMGVNDSIPYLDRLNLMFDDRSIATVDPYFERVVEDIANSIDSSSLIVGGTFSLQTNGFTDIKTSIQSQYLTSINREIQLSAFVDPPSIAPLIEWRVDGQQPFIGDNNTIVFPTVGTHSIEVGPVNTPKTLQIKTYRVTSIDHDTELDANGTEVITFTANTDPPGFEDKVSWLSGTKYGTAWPVTGIGATFTVSFENTFGQEKDGSALQWFGVKSSNAIFGQDQKPQTQCRGLCGGGGGATQYDPAIAVNQDLHAWDLTCAAGGVKNVGELITAICDKFTAQGNQQISVFLDGHGCSGCMSVGNGKDDGNGQPFDETMSNAATVLNSNNAQWFHDQIKDKVTTITLFGCSVGSDQAFLDAMASPALGVKAYDQTVCTFGGVNGNHRPTQGATLKCGT